LEMLFGFSQLPLVDATDNTIHIVPTAGNKAQHDWTFIHDKRLLINAS